jgi:hypothetical protein
MAKDLTEDTFVMLMSQLLIEFWVEISFTLSVVCLISRLYPAEYAPLIVRQRQVWLETLDRLKWSLILMLSLVFAEVFLMTTDFEVVVA